MTPDDPGYILRMITRRTPLKRSQKPIPKKRAKPRRGTADDPGYRAFLRKKGFCAVCWLGLPVSTVPPSSMWCGGCDPCHTQNGGMRLKGPASSCAPLCRRHHDEYDGRDKLPNGKVGRAAFEAFYKVDMGLIAKSWWDLYREKKS